LESRIRRAERDVVTSNIVNTRGDR
jgi:hypothetical protein